MRWKAPFTLAEMVKKKMDFKGDVRRTKPSSVAEKVQVMKDYHGDVRRAKHSSGAKRVKMIDLVMYMDDTYFWS